MDSFLEWLWVGLLNKLLGITVKISSNNSLSLISNSSSSGMDGWIWSEVSGLFGATFPCCINCVCNLRVELIGRIYL